MLVAPLLRRLTPGTDHAAFRRAWLPDESVPDDPRRVLTARDVTDPDLILTLALVDATREQVAPFLTRVSEIEHRRAARLAPLVSPPIWSGLYEVLTDDHLAHL